jgi:hypothetical protein
MPTSANVSEQRRLFYDGPEKPKKSALYDLGAWPEDNVRIAVVALNRKPLDMLRRVESDLHPLPHLLFVLNSDDDLPARRKISDIAKWCSAHDVMFAELDVPNETAQTLLHDFDSLYHYGVRTPMACWDFEDVRTVLADKSLRKRVIVGVGQATGDDAIAIATIEAMKAAGLTGEADWGAGHQKLTGVLSIAAVSRNAGNCMKTSQQAAQQLRAVVPVELDFLPSTVYGRNFLIDEVRISVMAVGCW